MILEKLELEEQAAEVARNRGHQMGSWIGIKTPTSRCGYCGAIAQVDPEAKHVPIRGSALTTFCFGKDAA
jgi:hypothetical protein